MSIAPWEKQLITEDNLDISLEFRKYFANHYLEGNGIEIGALHNPLPVPDTAKVKYVDRMTTADLKWQYPELASENLVEVDIVDNGEFLTTIRDSSQDFAIANHFLEHCQDPITSLVNILRVLKSGGVLYLAIPDRRFSFDSPRRVTSFEHLLKDYQEGPEWSKKEHFEDWVKLVEKVEDPDEIANLVNKMIEADYSIHFHVWQSFEFLDFLFSVKKIINLSFEIETFFENGAEVIAILKKE
jgi:predicted SAM-dependent methyltransferase